MRQQYTLKCIVHSVGEPAIHVLYHVAVGVQRDRDVGVPEHLLNELGMLACHEEYCSARMPKIVQGGAACL